MDKNKGDEKMLATIKKNTTTEELQKISNSLVAIRRTAKSDTSEIVIKCESLEQLFEGWNGEPPEKAEWFEQMPPVGAETV